MRLFPILDIQLVDISPDVLVKYTKCISVSSSPVLADIGRLVIIKDKVK